MMANYANENEVEKNWHFHLMPQNVYGKDLGSSGNGGKVNLGNKQEDKLHF